MESKIEIAVKKEPGHLPGGGFHYMTFPMAMGEHGMDARAFRMMGYIIVEVDKSVGLRLLEQARAALQHQLEIAVLADAAEKL